MQMRRLLQHVQLGSQHLAGLLLQHGFLQRHPALPGSGGVASPAEVSPAERGERLMLALIAIGEPFIVPALSAKLVRLLVLFFHTRHHFNGGTTQTTNTKPLTYAAL